MASLRSVRVLALACGLGLVTARPSSAAFGTAGRVVTSIGFGAIPYGLVIQPDGKLVAAGHVLPTSMTEALALVRYDADGSLDASFGSGGIVTTAIGRDHLATAIVVQPDGKLVVAGYVNVDPHTTFRDFLVLRYNADGTLDGTFGSGGKVLTDFGGDDGAAALVLQPDGKLVAAGFTEPPMAGGTRDFALARYDSLGTLDPGFGTGGMVTTDFAGADDVAQALVLQSDGKLVAAGSSGPAGGGTDFALVRYASDGSLDAGFGSGGRLTTDFAGRIDAAFALALQPDGELVAAGSTLAVTPGSDADFALARFDTGGALDAGFGTGGMVTTDFAGLGDYARALVVQPDGKLVAAGVASIPRQPPVCCQFNEDFGLARYHSDGTLDVTFGTGGLVSTDFAASIDIAYALQRQADGKLVAAGFAQGGNGSFGLVRYESDGTRDACPSAPRAGCRTSRISQLVIADKTPDTKDKLMWRWSAGQATSLADFGTPTTTTSYQLCIYDGSGPRLGIGMPARIWAAKGTNQFKYTNRFLGPDGVYGAQLLAGDDGKARVVVNAKGSALAPPPPPFASLPLTVQLSRSDGGPCWGGVYSAPTENKPGLFRARGD